MKLKSNNAIMHQIADPIQAKLADISRESEKVKKGHLNLDIGGTTLKTREHKEVDRGRGNTFYNHRKKNL